MTATSHEQSLRARLRQWFASVPGRLLCDASRAAVAGCLPNLFGYHIVQIGGYDDRSLLDVRPRRIVILDEGKATDVPPDMGSLDDDDDLDDDDYSDVDVDVEAA